MQHLTQNMYKLLIAYDGTDYQGWQSQPHGKTVADTINTVFTLVFGHACSLLGASRTDSGVHARGQVARLLTSLSLPPEKMQNALNARLPQSIVIRSITPDNFHPHIGVAAKTYSYRLFLERPDPCDARYGWYPALYTKQFSYDLFVQVLNCFIGTHDFAAFCKRDVTKDTMRTITAIQSSLSADEKSIKVVITGHSFLQYQIRRMVGAAVMVAGNGPRSIDYVQGLLAQPRILEHSLEKASPAGLCLESIVYTT